MFYSQSEVAQFAAFSLRDLKSPAVFKPWRAYVRSQCPRVKWCIIQSHLLLHKMVTMVHTLAPLDGLLAFHDRGSSVTDIWVSFGGKLRNYGHIPSSALHEKKQKLFKPELRCFPKLISKQFYTKPTCERRMTVGMQQLLSIHNQYPHFVPQLLGKWPGLSLKPSQEQLGSRSR